MADSVTLLSLRTKVRQRADMVNTLFVTDTEVNGYINDSYKALYDLLVDAVEDYNLTASPQTISTGNTFNLPSDFYKMRGLDDLSDSSNPKSVRKFMFGERNRYTAESARFPLSPFSEVVYRIEGTTIAILPAVAAARTYQLWYVPTPTLLSGDNSTIDVIQGFDEYIIVDAAIKCLIKEESDITGLTMAKQEQLERITRMKSNRDQGAPERVNRIRNRGRRGLWFWEDVNGTPFF